MMKNKQINIKDNIKLQTVFSIMNEDFRKEYLGICELTKENIRISGYPKQNMFIQNKPENKFILDINHKKILDITDINGKDICKYSKKNIFEKLFSLFLKSRKTIIIKYKDENLNINSIKLISKQNIAKWKAVLCELRN